MSDAVFPSPFPLAAALDQQYGLPAPQQLLFTPTIMASLILLFVVLVAVIYFSRRARGKARQEARRGALKIVEKMLLKGGGNPDDVDRVLFIFNSYPQFDPAAHTMLKDKFRDELRPLLEKSFDAAFGERIEKILFPPPRDTRRALAAQTQDVKKLVEEQKASSAGQTPAAILDLMDATLKPGSIVRLTFDGVEGGYECLVMGHDLKAINVTLPANNDRLIASLRSGMRIDGMLESGPSLMAFSSQIIQAVAGSMPYCRISPWKAVWEVRKRESIRLPIVLEIDFQHISTAASESINMSSLEREIGTVRPGRLVDVSLGGGCIETPSGGVFRVGDMIRFSKSLVAGNPPATLLGALVKVDSIDPSQNEGSLQRLHMQFLVIDDVSQRILARTLRQLQDMRERTEWVQAQQLMQKMRRNKIQNIGSPAAVGIRQRPSTTSISAATSGRPETRGVQKTSGRPSTRSILKTTDRPPTRSLPKAHDRPAPPNAARTPTARSATDKISGPPPGDDTANRPL